MRPATRAAFSVYTVPMAPIDIFDIAVFSVFMYGLIMLLKQTRALFVTYGIIIVSVVYAAALAFGLRLTAAALHLFFSVLLIGLVIIFQAELRRYFELIAIWTGAGGAGKKKPGSADIDRVAAVAARFAGEKIGMLVVFVGREAIGRHVKGGFVLGGKISEPILESIFDASSPGHDGAVVIEDGMIAKFGVHLPLSQDFGQIETYGTRHSAGLGIAEVSDALAVIVSEEKGTMTVARDGKLAAAKTEAELRSVIASFLREKHGARKSALMRSVVSDIPEKALAVLLSVAAWFIVVFPHAK